MRLGRNFRQRQPVSQRTPIQRAIALLRRLGTNAHVWLPGVGSLNGLTAANYLLSDASTGLAPVDQVVGRVNDALGGLGAELVTATYATQPTYDNTTTSVSISSFTQAAGTTAPRSILNFSSVSGSSYLVTARLIAASAGTIGVNWRGASNGLGSVVAVTAALTTSLVSVIVKADSAASSLQFFGSATASFFSVGNISVREVTGIHAVQATTANKPILRRGAVNLLTYSGDFANAAWGKFGGTSVTTSSVTLGSNYTTGVYQLKTFSVGAKVTAAFALSGTPGVVVSINITDNGGAYLGSSVQVTLSDTPTIHVVNRTLGENICTAQINDYGTATTVTCDAAALFQGTYTAAQIQALGGIPITTSAPASTALGPYFWQFDGSNDSLVLGSVPFQQADDHAVIAGAMCSSAASDKIVFSIRSAVSATPILSQLGFLAGAPDAVWRDDANTLCRPAGGGSKLNQTVVMSARKTGNNKILRVNGTQPDTTNTVALGATTVASAAIGAAVTTAAVNHMQGDIGPVIAIKGTVTDAELLLLERLVASLSGITI